VSGSSSGVHPGDCGRLQLCQTELWQAAIASTTDLSYVVICGVIHGWQLSSDPMHVLVSHLRDESYVDDDYTKATSMELVNTMKDLLNMNPLYGEQFRTLISLTGGRHSTAQHGTAQHSTAQHSTAQHSTAQHSTAQHSTAAPPPGGWSHSSSCPSSCSAFMLWNESPSSQLRLAAVSTQTGWQC
jgi:hypothetical protein